MIEKLRGHNIENVKQIINKAKFEKSIFGYRIYQSKIVIDNYWKETYTIIFKDKKPFAIMKGEFNIVLYKGRLFGFQEDYEYGYSPAIIDISNGHNIFDSLYNCNYRRLNNKGEK